MSYIPQSLGSFKTIIAGVAAANSSFTLPANAFIQFILVKNNTANAVTGGVKIGTTAGATDVVAAVTIGASSISAITDALLLKRFFSTSATQQLFIDAVAAWNSASLDITIIYAQL